MEELKRMVREFREVGERFNIDGNAKDQFRLMDLREDIENKAEELGFRVKDNYNYTDVIIEMVI